MALTLRPADDTLDDAAEATNTGHARLDPVAA